MSSRERLTAGGYTTSRGARLRALEVRIAWIDAKLLQLAGTNGNGMRYLQIEREATYWAWETLSALVECHSLSHALQQERKVRARAEAQNDADRQT